MRKIIIDGVEYAAINRHNRGYDTAAAMREWTEADWKWWGAI